MEAGLLSTKGEERMMSKEPLLSQEDYPTRPRTSRMSPARRALIIFGVCCLLVFGIAAVGVTKHVCPGHLRHGMGHSSMTPQEDAGVETLRPEDKQFISSIIELARRQETNNSQSTPLETSTPPVSTSNPLPNTSTTPLPPTSTNTPPASTTNLPTSVPSTTPGTSSSPPPNTSTPAPESSTVTPPTTSTPAPTTRPTTQPEQSTTTPRTTAPGTTTQPSPSPSTGEQETSAAQETTAPPETRATITTGTKTTSKPVPQTFTSTLSGGGVTTITSTSWVAVVPVETSGSSGGSPDLQNAAPQFGPGLAISAVIALAGGFLLL